MAPGGRAVRRAGRGLLVVALLCATVVSDNRFTQPLVGVGTLLAQIPGTGTVFSGTVPRRTDLALTVERSKSVPKRKGALAFGGGVKIDTATRNYPGRLQVRLHLPPRPTTDAVPGVAVVWERNRVAAEPALWDPSANDVVFWVAAPFGGQGHDWIAAWWKPSEWAKGAQLDVSFSPWIDHRVGAEWRACPDSDVRWAVMYPPPFPRPYEVDALSRCLRGLRPSRGVDRVTIELTSSLAAVQLIQVPSAAASLNIDGPHELQPILRRLAGGGRSDVVILGERALRATLERPNDDANFHFRSIQTWPVVAANLITTLLGGLTQSELEVALIAAGLCASQHRSALPTLSQLQYGVKAQTLVAPLISCPIRLLKDARQATARFRRLLSGTESNVERRATARLRQSLDAIAPTARRIAPVIDAEARVIMSHFAYADVLAAVDAVTVELDGRDRNPIDLRHASGCYKPCWVSGRVHMRHPTWGDITLVTTLAGGNDKVTSHIKAIDSRGIVRWSRSVDAAFALAPAGVDVLYHGKRAVKAARDRTGNVFLTYNPGRYDGVIVLRPTADGFDDFASLNGGRWYGGEILDYDHDDVFEITSYPCDPQCITYGWNGRTYVKRSVGTDNPSFP